MSTARSTPAIPMNGTRIAASVKRTRLRRVMFCRDDDDVLAPNSIHPGAGVKNQRGRVAAMRVVRVITRLNVGGPSIQAITLSDRLAARGFETLLVHGQLDSGEGDMRYLL